ncbi:GDSL esterase/lipase 5-like [Prosopis cineraria]|uniref:GDSL esterase/lipase 5-like n=1 Tax=Prosopis cineraria TaxID=364024 RepID=UPI00240EA504|nr:GDSL esterase/lipase 5-like [Prosopis cineraria]
MANLSFYLNRIVLCTTLIACFSFRPSHSEDTVSHETAGSSAFFIFGDSTVDSGNNNYIETSPENRADYEPYGQNGFFERPTGRFSDGRIIVDFIAEYANLPLIPPFLQRSADHTNGVNFASGGAGVLPETNQGLVIDLQTQVKNFEEVRKGLVETVGEERAKEIVEEAVYFISIGSNDYMGGYLGNPKMQKRFTPEQYVGMVVGNLTQIVQRLYEKGGRKFGFLSLGPLGCLPALRALSTEGGCLEAASALALAHNHALSSILSSLQLALQGFTYSNSNFYDWLHDRIHNPSAYGFKEGEKACCGSGPYGGIFSCGGTKKTIEYNLCDNVNDHVWWDSFHPTQIIHHQFALTFWNGPPSSVAPFNLHHLFTANTKRTIADVVDQAPQHQFDF